MVAQSFILSLIVSITVTTVFLQCDFGNDDCDSIGVVAGLQAGPAILADRGAPDRAKADGGDAGPGLPDGDWGAWWMTILPHPGMPARVAWYPPWVAPGLASIVDKPPDIPPRA